MAPAGERGVEKGGDALGDFSSTALPSFVGHAFALNLPAFLIVAAVTVLLVYGIRESAKANTTIVIVKVSDEAIAGPM